MSYYYIEKPETNISSFMILCISLLNRKRLKQECEQQQKKQLTSNHKKRFHTIDCKASRDINDSEKHEPVKNATQQAESVNDESTVFLQSSPASWA